MTSDVVTPMPERVVMDDGAADPAPEKEFGIMDGARSSNLAATRRLDERVSLTTAEQAIADLQPVFDSLGLGDRCEAVAKAMCNMRHHTWRNGIEGLNAWMSDELGGCATRLQNTDIKLNVSSIGKLQRAVREACEPAKPPPPPSKCAVRVRCGETELKLTLTAKFLERPLVGALVAPYLKAYSKRVGGTEVTAADVERVEIEGEAVDTNEPVGRLLHDPVAGALRAEAMAVIVLR